MTGEESTAVVTGIGIVSPLGSGRQAFWTNLCAGQSGIAPITRFPVSPGAPALAAEVRDFSPRDFIGAVHLRRMDRLSRMIVAAARMALTDANIALDGVPAEAVAVVVGSALGNTSESETYLHRVLERGPAAASPMLFPNLVMNAPAAYVAMECGLTGTNFTLSHGGMCGEQAIGVATDLLRCGRAEIALAGGGDEVSRIVYDIYRSLRALSSQRGGTAWSSPYDCERNGTILGEGAAMLAIENAARARSRGARIYAAIEQYAAFSITAPPYDWPARARAVPASLQKVLSRHGAAPRPLDLICGSANSTPRLDACEIGLFARLCGEAAPRTWLTSIKGAVGDFGAAGALTTAAAVLALHDQAVPPLCHLRRPDPAAPFRFARPQAQPAPLQRALVCGLARGGAGTALLLRRED